MGVQINGDTGNISATKADYSGNVTIGGTLTYEDVTNIDSVGLVTARSGIEVGARPGVGASISVDGNAIFSGITTATTLRAPTGIVTTLTTNTLTANSTAKVGSGVTLSPDGNAFFTGIITATTFSGVDTDKISEGNTEVETVDTGSDGHVKITTEGSERFRVNNIGIMTSYYSGNRGGISLLGAFQAENDNNSASEGIVPAVTTDNIHCFDACGWYDNSNYRYTPQVKGHYMFNFSGQFGQDMSGSNIEQSFAFYLNGVAVSQYADGYSTNFGNYYFLQLSQMIFCNGTTDYVQAWMSSNRSPYIFSTTKWSGYLVHPVA